MNEKSTLDSCKETYETKHYLIDPHTAVGYGAAKQYLEMCKQDTTPVAILSTAHACKFQKALKGIVPEDVMTTSTPAEIHQLHDKPERFEVVIIGLYLKEFTDNR